jgi:hypothetical protein
MKKLSMNRGWLLGAASSLVLMGSMPSGAGTLKLEIEGAQMEATDSNAQDGVVYGAQFNFVPGATTFDRIGRGDGDSYRGAVQWQFDGAWSARLGYGTGNTSGSASANGDFNYPMITQAPTSGYFFFPLYSQYFANSSAQIDSEVEFVDFEVGHDVGLGSATARIFGGVRYAKFDETTDAFFGNGLGGYFQSQTLSVRKESEFSGFGPRVGVDFDLPIVGGLSIGGVFAASMLFGEVDTRINRVFTSNFDGVISGSSAITSSDDTAYTVEISPMVSYKVASESVNAKISLGYRFDSYLGVADTQTRQNIVPAGFGFGDPADDAEFEGAFVKLGVEF